MMRTGRVWLFGHNINTDLIQPGHALLRPPEEGIPHIFEANRPGWIDRVRGGDIIVAGHNFGTGSSRPAAQVLVAAGIGGLIAESINGLFFRNCVNYGLPALECSDATTRFAEGDEASLDVASGLIRNLTRGTETSAPPWAPELLQILDAGGLLQQLEAEGRLVQPTGERT
jgi:3-isopropylmalate/(R)-2-methylmalate dehydratase small subunit